MTLPVAARIARRELRGGLDGFRVFLACLALGVAAIAAVGTVRDSIRAGLDREGATILGGDAEIELTYRFAEPDERAWIEGRARAVSEIVDFRSMAVFASEDGDEERSLTQVKGVDEAYPLLGAVDLSPEMPLDTAFAGQGGRPGAVMDPVLVARLGMEVGDTLRLGETEFVLMAELLSEPDRATAGFALGPRTMVRTEALDGSGLIQPGTLFETEYKLLLPEGTDLDEMRAATDAEITGARWSDRRNGAPGIAEFVDRLGAFLVLVGLAGLAVGGVGVSAAVTAYLDGKTGVIATLKTLGADRRTIFQTYFLQIGALTLLGLAIGLVLGALTPFVFGPLIEAQLPVPAEIGIRPVALAEAALYGALAALVFTIWPLARTERVRAATLFRDGAAGAGYSLPRPLWLAVTGGLVLMLVGVAAWLSGLVTLTLWSAAGVLAAFVVLVGAAYLARWVARRLSRARALRGKSALRLAMGAVGGPGGETASVVLSLGLGLTVLAAVGQIDANLRGAIARDLPQVAPSFFMLDIQPDQLDDFRARLDANEAVETVESAPMLRGIITGINGRPAAEVGGDHWTLQGDRGVTYAATLPEGTTITAGSWWSEDYTGAPQVSFAAEEAEELGLSLGDTLTVNILGRDITAEITSFREVDFSTAGIGFIMAMNPSALAGAPHTHIATVYADEDAEASILREISNAYPNVTAIRVRDAIDRVSEILAGIAAAITYGALATLVTGGVVLIGAAAAGVRARTFEAAVLKTLGASRGTILKSFALRSAFLGLAAAVVAIAAGALAGWAVTTFVMDTDFVFEPVSALLIVLGGVLATLLAGLFFAWAPLSARPAGILRARE
ncbi:FtsX-like permease family protein [Alphaproteobacteria bacterium GH1-50]|uniref:FtsX-like permease family protein n=1 Tax=Kangsaoukella pontilimi TaxID=2691042 RepID=A0A7C9N040_9RHOB|nr:FtsX-like permease family protein [Kangsaoukella pontilimi]MXQ07958.1 FtsX-like permease family protein [Kangsaoukella pontilimi]